MVTFGGIAKISTESTLMGVKAAQKSGLLSESEGAGLAVAQVAEMNTIQPDDRKSTLGSLLEDKSGSKSGLDKPTYNALGRLGQMTALKRVGADQSDLSGTSLSLLV